MYLSKLSLHGFKSFAEPTSLDFAPGVTAIVGPNGCGKSNIVDAVRWAIGEQRPTALRSETMDDVIFNGTSRRKPLGMAEVELTVENNRNVLPTEYSEVAIGRRLFRDGTSEYLMNGQTCRLKDITGLFEDTGMGADAYSVIELKMIDEILSESPEDRRHLFEEAAGITRYKRRRRQALRKLDNTQADLDRLRDLTGEVGKKVRRLEKQAERAEQHRTLSRTLHRQERALAEAEYARLAGRRQALGTEKTALQEQADALEERQAGAEERLEKLRERLSERESTRAERREALEAARDEVRRLEGEQRLQQERLLSARRDAKRLRRATRRAADRREDLTAKQERLTGELEDAAPAQEQAEAALEEATAARDAAQSRASEKRETLRTLRGKEQAQREAHAEQRSRLDRLTSRLDALDEERRRAYDRADRLDAEAATLDERLSDARRALEAAEAAAEEARVAHRTAEADKTERDAAVEEAVETLHTLRQRREAARAEADLLETLVSSYDDLSEAVQFLAEEAAAEAGPLRTVADVLACDDAHRAALAAALGDYAGTVVVKTDAEVHAAVRRLREAEKGQATFVVLSRLPEPPGALEAPEGAPPLRPLVRTADSSFEPLADALLQNVFLAETLDEAERLAAGPPVRAVTPGGEWAGGPGLVRGGSSSEKGEAASPAAGRLGRREQLQDARQTLAALDADIEAQEERVADRREAQAAVPLDERAAALREAEAAQSEAAGERRRLAHEQDTLAHRQSETTDRLDALDEELSEGRDELESLQENAAATDAARQALREERAASEAAFEEAEAAAREAQERFGETRVAAVEARSRRASLQSEMEQTQERLAEIARRQEEREDERAALQETIESTEEKQTALQDEIDEARTERIRREEAAEEARDASGETKAVIAEAEHGLRTLRQEREEALRKESTQSVKLAEVKTRLEDLVESTKEDFGLWLPDDAEAPTSDFDEEAVRQEVAALRKKRRRLGDVNPLALKEFDEEKERLDFLTEQKQDLEDAEDTLLETITEINAEAAARFEDTFAAIQKSFADLFERLFGHGAAARLQLDEDQDPLESDVEIVARPKGKRPSILSQLSGGEKALTAIALLFAIYLVKPSPFCILDEVDAPLDDANTSRFMNLIRDFTGETQFILVTHNKRAMAQSDRLYGVTMQEQGVSTLVGVEIEEAAELAEAAA